jgi:hypothetical protein
MFGGYKSVIVLVKSVAWIFCNAAIDCNWELTVCEYDLLSALNAIDIGSKAQRRRWVLQTAVESPPEGRMSCQQHKDRPNARTHLAARSAALAASRKKMLCC